MARARRSPMRNPRSASRASLWAGSSNDRLVQRALRVLSRGRGRALAYRSAAPHWPPSPSDAAGHTARAQPAPPCHPQRPADPVVSERLTNDATVDAALDALRASGTTGEIFLREAQSGSVEIKEGAVEAVIARGERGIGLRVLDDRRLGFAYTSDLSLNGIRECADTARRMSALTERDEDLALATKAIDDADLDIYQSGIVDRPLGERAAIARAVGEAARDAQSAGRARSLDGDGPAAGNRTALLRGQRAERPESVREQDRAARREREGDDRRRRSSAARPPQRPVRRGRGRYRDAHAHRERRPPWVPHVAEDGTKARH